MLAVVGLSAVPLAVHDIKSAARHGGVDDCNMLILDCLLDEVRPSTVRRAARIVRDMHRDAKEQGMKLHVSIAAIADRQGNIRLTGGYRCERRAFLTWMRSLVEHKVKSTSPPVNENTS